MSDISLNLDGLIAFLVAASLGLLLLLGIVVGSIIAAIRAQKKRERFRQQRFFPHLIGMLASFACCLAIELLLLLTDTTLPPRNIPVWLDNWAFLWAVAVLALWPFTVLGWKKLGAPA